MRSIEDCLQAMMRRWPYGRYRNPRDLASNTTRNASIQGKPLEKIVIDEMNIYFPKHSLVYVRVSNVWYLFEAFFHVSLLQMHCNRANSIMILLCENTHPSLFSVCHWPSQPIYCWSFDHLIVYLGKLNTNINQETDVTKKKSLRNHSSKQESKVRVSYLDIGQQETMLWKVF